MKTITAYLRAFRTKYLPLIKSPQTFLLLLTGLAGYMSARCPIFNLTTLLSTAGSLFLAISGSTVLNMWYDRDIDAQMPRTCKRPLAQKTLLPRQAFAFGALMAGAGVIWSLWLDGLYGLVVFAGLFFDVVIYTIWLKRRTAWSILWGGIAGGMPILAGRTLGLGRIDWIGLTLALAILFWIPTHILTFSIRYHADYQSAKIPTFPSTYGFRTTRRIIAFSTILAALAMCLSAYGVGMTWGLMRLLALLSAVLLLIAVRSMINPSEKINLGLFKYASLYMMGAMLLLVITGI